jgi:hypothetical protein
MLYYSTTMCQLDRKSSMPTHKTPILLVPSEQVWKIHSCLAPQTPSPVLARSIRGSVGVDANPADSSEKTLVPVPTTQSP